MDSGWLTDIRPADAQPLPAHAYAKFKGDPSLAFWHMDGELAQAVEDYGKPYGGKTDQRVTFVRTASRSLLPGSSPSSSSRWPTA